MLHDIIMMLDGQVIHSFLTSTCGSIKAKLLPPSNGTNPTAWRPGREGGWIRDPLRTHAPIVEDDQDIGEPDGSVTINIGRAIIGCWLTIVTGAAFGPSAAHRRAV